MVIHCTRIALQGSLSPHTVRAPFSWTHQPVCVNPEDQDSLFFSPKTCFQWPECHGGIHLKWAKKAANNVLLPKIDSSGPCPWQTCWKGIPSRKSMIHSSILVCTSKLYYIMDDTWENNAQISPTCPGQIIPCNLHIWYMVRMTDCCKDASAAETIINTYGVTCCMKDCLRN